MCYDVSLTKSKAEVQEYFGRDFAFPGDYEKYYHRSGFDYPKVQIIKMSEPSLIIPATWGFVPDWATDISAFRKKYNTLNITSENLFSGVAKDAAHTKRCLIIADGFFEPHRRAGESIPYFCYIPTTKFQDGRNIFAFGGVYSEENTSSKSLTCSLITMPANPFFAEVHNAKKRQPFVIDEGLYQEWMNVDLTEKQIEELIFDGFTSKKFSAHPVSRELFNKNINTDKSSTLEEISLPGLLF